MASDVVIDQSLRIPLLEHSNKLLKYACNDKDRKARFSDVALLSGKKVCVSCSLHTLEYILGQFSYQKKDS